MGRRLARRAAIVASVQLHTRPGTVFWTTALSDKSRCTADPQLRKVGPRLILLKNSAREVGHASGQKSTSQIDPGSTIAGCPRVQGPQKNCSLCP